MQLDVRLLTEAEYPLWDELAASSAQGTLFAKRWWMETVTDGQYQLLGCFTGNRLVGGLPLWPCTTLGVRRLRQPPLTPYWGPLLGQIEGTYTTRLGTEMSILRALAEALQPWPDITMQFHVTLQNWLPFYWEGFAQTTRYTYRIENMTEFPLDEASCQKSVRQKLKLARQQGLRVEEHLDPRLVAEMHALTMHRQGLEPSAEIMRLWPKLAAAGEAHECLYTLGVYDEAGNLHTARAMFWGDSCAYALFGGSDPRFRKSGATTLSMWSEMVMSARLARSYDFEGSTIEPIETFFRAFGGTLTPYLLVTRDASPRLRLARAANAGLNWLRTHLRRPDRTPPGEEAEKERATA